MSRQKRTPHAAAPVNADLELARQAAQAAQAARSAVAARFGGEVDSLWTGLTTVHYLAERPLMLPRWQRAAVWSPDRAAAYCDALLKGVAVAPMMLAERTVGGRRALEVLDGQQRCLALGLTLTCDGELRSGATAHLCLADLTWHAEPAPGRLTLAQIAAADIYDRLEADGIGHRSPQTAALASIMNIVMRRSWPAVRVDGATSRQTMRELFAAWNQPGVAFAPEEVAALLAEHPE